MSQDPSLREPNLAVYKGIKQGDFLRKILIFKDMSDSSLGLIARRIQMFELKKGDMVIAEDEAAKGVFFIYSGAVKLTKQDENGNEVIVCIKQAGDVFAEACLFTRQNEQYPATATLLSDGRLGFLDKQELEQDLYQYPELAIQLIGYMSDALREKTQQLRDVALLDVYAKTVRALERLGKQFNTECKRWGIEIPLTVQEFATVVGTTRESVSRVFSKLKKEEMIDLKSRKIVILDWCKFCTLLQRDF